ncbi:glutathione-disulfide reductase [Trinickia mobilis]|uniref:glutathione-disulfide reductase n=1 Tax=Trinickia mobilis TaxID=2816356 RepID=UPI001A8F2055|nr:glutathione-disulfide reductase [Trinickia mobilis]
MNVFDVDLLVIGAGSGGVRAARAAAGHGATVAIAEQSRVGGTCVIRGCVPKKIFVYASRLEQSFSDAVGFGWSLSNAQFDWPTLLRNKNTEIARLEGLYRLGLAKAGVSLIDGRAVVEDDQTVRIEGTDHRYRARRVLIATGGTPNRGFDVPGIEHAIDSDAVFELEHLPRSVLIVGGGYIAVEFAGIMHGLGVQTNLLHRGTALLRGFDNDVQIEIERAYRKRGIGVRLHATLKRIDRTDRNLRATLSDGTCLEVEAVILAAGRLPNTRGLGLESVGVELDPEGAIRVDDTAQSSVPWIYAVGDVTNRVNLTPVAIREGQAFADRSFGTQFSYFDYQNIPTAIFSTPEVAVVGLNEIEARQRCPTLEIFRTDFRPMKSSITASTERIHFKLLVDASSDKVLGAQVIGDGAAEMIQLIAVAMRAGATKGDFDRTVALHPTVAEEWTTLRVSEKCHWSAETADE